MTSIEKKENVTVESMEYDTLTNEQSRVVIQEGINGAKELIGLSQIFGPLGIGAGILGLIKAINENNSTLAVISLGTTLVSMLSFCKIGMRRETIEVLKYIRKKVRSNPNVQIDIPRSEFIELVDNNLLGTLVQAECNFYDLKSNQTIAEDNQISVKSDHNNVYFKK